MNDNDTLFESVAPRLEQLVRSNAVVGDVISVGHRHAIPLVELSMSLGGGGGGGEGTDPEHHTHGSGTGSAAGGGVKDTPVAVLVIEDNQVRIQPLGH